MQFTQSQHIIPIRSSMTFEERVIEEKIMGFTNNVLLDINTNFLNSLFTLYQLYLEYVYNLSASFASEFNTETESRAESTMI